MIKIFLIIIFILGFIIFLFKDSLIDLVNDDIIHIKQVNQDYKNKPDNLEGTKFTGESLDIYEVTRERLLPKTEIIENEKFGDKVEEEIKFFYIQLASYKSIELAEAKINELVSSEDLNIREFKYSIVDVEIIDRGLFYRLRVGPFKTLDEVYKVCSVFQISKKECIILEELPNKA